MYCKPNTIVYSKNQLQLTTLIAHKKILQAKYFYYTNT